MWQAGKMTEPQRPPHGALIESARLAAGISLAQAVRLAGVAKDTWINTVRGYNGVGAEYRARPRTVARMAHAVGIDAERLEAEGECPAAAAILREMDRPPPLRAVPPLPAGTRHAERGNVLFPDLSPDLRPEAVPHYDDYEARIILAATAAAARRGITLDEALAELPDAAAVFPEAERGQERMWWDLIKSWELPSGQYSYRQMAHQLAVLRVLWDRAETGQSSAGAGLAAARLPAVGRSKPGHPGNRGL